jgi:AGZA family xanthine/uracil permease-like MFS transporter
VARSANVLGAARGGLGVTAGIALAYAVVAGGSFALAKIGAATLPVSHPEMPLAAPAE